jgi:hypothetical protein
MNGTPILFGKKKKSPAENNRIPLTSKQKAAAAKSSPPLYKDTSLHVYSLLSTQFNSLSCDKDESFWIPKCIGPLQFLLPSLVPPFPSFLLIHFNSLF